MSGRGREPGGGAVELPTRLGTVPLRQAGSQALLNAGPWSTAELAALVDAIPERRLARIWVGLVVDLLTVRPLRIDDDANDIGNTARALGTIARRLTGIQVPQELLAMPKVASKPTAPAAPAPAGKAAPEIQSGPPPAPTAGASPLAAVLRKLEPGQWVKLDPGQSGRRVGGVIGGINRGRSAGGKLRSYRHGPDLIVIRD